MGKLVHLGVKLKGSTLLETLVATIIILLIFMISSLLINNLVKTNTQTNHRAIKTEMKRLGYLAQHAKLNFPFEEDFQNWEISLIKRDKPSLIDISAVQTQTKQELKSLIYVQN